MDIIDPRKRSSSHSPKCSLASVGIKAHIFRMMRVLNVLCLLPCICGSPGCYMKVKGCSAVWKSVPIFRWKILLSSLGSRSNLSL